MDCSRLSPCLLSLGYVFSLGIVFLSQCPFLVSSGVITGQPQRNTEGCEGCIGDFDTASGTLTEYLEVCDLWRPGDHAVDCFPVGLGTIQTTCEETDTGWYAQRWEGACRGPKPTETNSCTIGSACTLQVANGGLDYYDRLGYRAQTSPCNITNPTFKQDWTVDRWGSYDNVFSHVDAFTPSYRLADSNIAFLCLASASRSAGPQIIPPYPLSAGTITLWPVVRASCFLGAPCYVIFLDYDRDQIRATAGVFEVDANGLSNEHANLGTFWRAKWTLLADYGDSLPERSKAAYFGKVLQREYVGTARYNVVWSFRGTLATVKELHVLGPADGIVIKGSCTLGLSCAITIPVSGRDILEMKSSVLICNKSFPHSPQDPVLVADSVPLSATFFPAFSAGADGAQVEEDSELCWQVFPCSSVLCTDTEPIQIGSISFSSVCPESSDSWPSNDPSLDLDPGKSTAVAYAVADCVKGRECPDCIQISPDGIEIESAGYFAMLDGAKTIRACSSKLTCDAPNCTLIFSGPLEVVAGTELMVTAWVGTHSCPLQARILVLAFGCQSEAIISYMIGVGIVLVATICIGLALEALARVFQSRSVEGMVELKCPTRDRPSVAALRSCIERNISPQKIKHFEAWSHDNRIFAKFRIPWRRDSSVHKFTTWVTELPGLCRVEASSISEIRRPGRLPGAGLLELAEAAAACCKKKTRSEEERLHFEFAEAILPTLRKTSVQCVILGQYCFVVMLAVLLPVLASFMMEDCESGYPLILHGVWMFFILVGGLLQYWILKLASPDYEFLWKFLTRFSLRCVVGFFIGMVSQTDTYMDLTFPVIAKSCNFDLWFVALWLCILGIGLGQVLQGAWVLISGYFQARRATTPEARERAELATLFFLLRLSDNVFLCFSIRPALEQRLGGSSTWTAKLAEARVPTARFFFEDLEQSALQVIFVLFFEVTTTQDLIWISLSITTSLLLSLLLMVQVLPEVRDWLWYRILAVVSRMWRLPLFLFVFALYRCFIAVPWLVACSQDVADTSFIGFEFRLQVLNELAIGCAATVAAMAVSCALVAAAWYYYRLDSRSRASSQKAAYDAEVRFFPSDFGAWSTEQDKWLQPFRDFLANPSHDGRRALIEDVDRTLFTLRYGCNSKTSIENVKTKAADIPGSLAGHVKAAMDLASIQKGVQDLLRSRSFSCSSIGQKSEMIDKLVVTAFPEMSSSFRVLPSKALSSGIPHANQNSTVSVEEAKELSKPHNFVVIVVSHCWMQPQKSPPHPDDENQTKAKALLEFVEWYSSFWSSRGDVYFWIDYSCIDHKQRDVSLALLPLYIASCTGILLWRSTDFENRSWNALERVLAYSYCESGITPYVIDASFKNCGQAPKRISATLPNPLEQRDSKSSVVADDHYVKQLLSCAMSVPANEVFPDRQSVSFGETEVIHLELTSRDSLRERDSVRDGFVDGCDCRPWLSIANSASQPIRIGARVMTKAQIEELMPADRVGAFARVEYANEKTARSGELVEVVDKIDKLILDKQPLNELVVGALLSALEVEIQESISVADENRLCQVLDTVHRLQAFPASTAKAKRELCLPRLVTALKGSDRVLHHALMVAQQYGLDSAEIPEFGAAAAEQERRRLIVLQAELTSQLMAGTNAGDLDLLFGVRQAALGAVCPDKQQDSFRLISDQSQESMAKIMTQKLTEAEKNKAKSEVTHLLDEARRFGVENSAAIVEVTKRVTKEILDISVLKTKITLRDKDAVTEMCQQTMQRTTLVWILWPCIRYLLEWARKIGPEAIMEALRIATLLDLDDEDSAVQVAVQEIHDTIGLPGNWEEVRKTWRSDQAINRVAVADSLLDSIQTFLDITFSNYRRGTNDRQGEAPTRLLVSSVVHVQHPISYFRYALCRSKMMKSLDENCEMDLVQNIKTAKCNIPGLHSESALNHDINEVLLFHGTNHSSVDKIASDGFRIDLSGSKTGCMFGRGAYFAECCLKSDEYATCKHDRRDDCCNEERPLLLCRVLLGKYYYTDEVKPSPLDCENHCLTGGYDSVLADREAANIKRGRNPTFREFVVFDRDQVYPEYIIWYTRSKQPFELPSQTLPPSVVAPAAVETEPVSTTVGRSQSVCKDGDEEGDRTV